MPLPGTFYARPARAVARDLLGQCLIRQWSKSVQLRGIIVETEAYCDGGPADLACHARSGRPSPRTAVMFGPPGHAYVYFTYGQHWLLNAVTGERGVPGAVLIRAIEPVTGMEVMARHRTGRPLAQWTNGPAKLTRALAIDGSLDGHDLTAGSGLWIDPHVVVPEHAVATGPRVGLGATPEPWRSVHWRYWIAGNPHVSQYR